MVRIHLVSPFFKHPTRHQIQLDNTHPLCKKPLMKTTFIVIVMGLFSINAFADIDVQIRGARGIRKELTEELSKLKIKVVSEKQKADYGVKIKRGRRRSEFACLKKRKSNSQFFIEKNPKCVYRFYQIKLIKNGNFVSHRVYSPNKEYYWHEDSVYESDLKSGVDGLAP